MLSLSRIQLQVLSIQPVEFELVPEVRRIVAIFNNELKMYDLPQLHVITANMIHVQERDQDGFAVRGVYTNTQRPTNPIR